MIQPSYQSSIDFLEKWRPGGSWVLTAIEPDRKGIDTRTFRAETKAELLKWLQTQGSRRNIYFHVNPTVRDLTEKADACEIASLDWLHVDIDPRAGEDIAQEQVRALALLQNPPGGLPPPTVILFSGGGYQGFWKLRDPLKLDGTPELAEEAKRYNLQIEIVCGADHVHNIDRIMRLPGTINRPDEKKKRKGRTEVLATLTEWHEDRVYDLEQFTKAPQVQSGTASGFSGRTVKVSGNIKRLADVDELPDKVSPRAKIVIVQGLDPDEPGKFPSRSEWLFYACCEMVRGGCDDDTIFSVITDPTFGISASVIDKGGNAEKYALRQIERAREDAIDPDLRMMNEKHAVIGNWCNQCRIVEELYDPSMKRFRLTRQSFEDFRNRYLHVQKQLGVNGNGQPILMAKGHWWLTHASRRQFDTIVFAPGKEVPGAYNLWRGFACDAKPGDCSLFLKHLEENTCSGNAEHLDYLLKWMARAVQEPDSPGYSAIVMRGGQGSGKGVVAKIFGSLFGRHFLHVTDPKHLVGSFNAHLRDCVFLFGDEAFYAGDKKHESILKTLITEELLAVEAKGRDIEVSSNCVHLMMSSNEAWAIPAGLDDRRFFVLDVGEGKKEDHNYFRAIHDQMNSGGREALLHMLMTMNLRGFNVRSVPKTSALQTQKILSMAPEEEWWFTKLREGRLLPHDSDWRSDVPSLDLSADFIQYMRNFGITGRRSNATKLGMFLQKVCPKLRQEQRRTPIMVKTPDGREQSIPRPYFYLFPSLGVCREHWDRNFGGPYEWPEIKDDQSRNDNIPF